MLITVKGKTVARQNGYKLMEYSCGDHVESIYYIVKDGETMETFYRDPRKNHKQAMAYFKDFMKEIFG